MLSQFMKPTQEKKPENPKALFPNLTKSVKTPKKESKPEPKFVPRVEKKVNRVINVRKGK